MKAQTVLLTALCGLLAVLCCSGCIVTAKPGIGCCAPTGCAVPPPAVRVPCFPPANCPPIQIITPPGTTTTTSPPATADTFQSTSLQSHAEATMPLTVTPSERLAMIYYEIARLVCATDQFQTETQQNAADSLDQFAWWPRLDKDAEDKLTAPLALVTQEPELLIVKDECEFAKGETFLQLALIHDSTKADMRDRWTDAANRAGAIMRQLLTLARDDSTEGYWQVSGYTQHQPSQINDLVEYPFQNVAGDEVRVEVFPFVLNWIG